MTIPIDDSGVASRSSCFEDRQDSATQDGTLGDRQRHQSNPRKRRLSRNLVRELAHGRTAGYSDAVMAGCRPDYLPVVIAAAECACDPAFNVHGVSTSTHFSAPLIVVNGSIRTRIGLNSAFGVFGPGYRANATIGRALRLLMINC